MLLSEGQMSDHTGASLMLDALPPAKALIAERGYDSAPFRQALVAKGIEPCIPSSKSRKIPYPYDKMLYRQRHKVENLFAKLKGWRRIATGFDQCLTNDLAFTYLAMLQGRRTDFVERKASAGCLLDVEHLCADNTRLSQCAQAI